MTASGRLVYRPALGRILVACYAAFVLWWLVAEATSPARHGFSWVAFAWLLAVGAASYALLWRPAVVVDDEGVLLRNVVRDVRVPWAALEAVQTQYALTLVTAARTYTSWAAGAPGRGSALARLGQGRAGPRSSEAARSAERARSSEAVPPSEAAPPADAAHLPRQGWIPGGVTPDRASRDLRTDSGAAAFMVEQAWVGWRERPQARAAAESGVPRVGVSWNVPVVAGPLLLAAAAAVAQAFGV